MRNTYEEVLSSSWRLDPVDELGGHIDERTKDRDDAVMR